MNGLDNITSKIINDAESSARSIIDRARHEAEAITEKARASSKKTSDEIITRGEALAAEREARLDGVSELEARKKTLSAKQELISEAFATALKELSKLSDADYIHTLARLALAACSSGSEQIILSAQDSAKHGKALISEINASGKTMSLSEETRETGGGLFLKDGATEVNCTFPTIIRLMRDELATRVSSILFN